MTVKANHPQGKSGLTSDASFDSDSKEYKLSTAVSFRVSDIVSYTIGDVLDMLDASLPDTRQTDVLKKIVKERLYKLTREIQHQVYYSFGIEPYQLGDDLYIKDVLDGTETNADGSPAQIG